MALDRSKLYHLMFKPKMIAFWILCMFLLGTCACNKYSEKFNSPQYQTFDKPFRMQKLNLIWEKATKKISPDKLKLLFSDLKYQDKEELALKKLKAEGLDKEGLKEALILSSFNAILDKYHLSNDFKALQEAAILTMPMENAYAPHDYYKIVFKDKKLNKLWLKAESQGFTEREMQTLKEEFQHHQNKIDQYYEAMNQLHKEPGVYEERSNAIEQFMQAEEGEKWWKAETPQQILKEKHADLKAGYHHLASKVIPSMRNMEFDEPHVNSLWELAKNASFSPVELDSLRNELHHFEHRLKKLKTLTSLANEDDHLNYVDESARKRHKKLQEYNYKVDKMQRELTSRILQRHSEL